MTAVTDAVGRYRAAGWKTVPVHTPDTATGGCSCGQVKCPKPGKHPDGRYWPGGADDPAAFDGRNLGVVLGPDSAGLIDVDLDCPEAVAVADLLLPPTEAMFGRGGVVTHRVYTAADGAAAFAQLTDPVLPGREATVVELRWPNADDETGRPKAVQTVFPPSAHYSGASLAWARDGAPAAVPGADLAAAVRRVGAAVLVARYARPKARHDLVLLLANLGVRAGWADDGAVVSLVAAVFAARSDADKLDKVLRGEGANAVADARKRVTAGKPMTGLPALHQMLDPALTAADADAVVARVRDWLGLPEPAPAGGADPGGPAEWETPVPLPEMDAAVPFPTHLFPPKVADYWRAAAVALHVPVDYVAVPSLAVLGAAVGRARAAEVKPGYAESPLFWTAVVAPPGATKSASLTAGRRPLDHREARWRADHEGAVAAFDAASARYELDLKEWKKSPEGEPPTKPRRPALRQSVLDDTTAEAAARVLQENPRGAVLVKDELIGFARMLNQYKGGGRGNDKTFWLTGWNGKGTVKVNRSKDHDRGPLVITDPFAAVAGMLCPDTLPELREELRRGGAVADGWADRFLFSYPERFPAEAEQWRTVPAELEEGYAEVVADLLGLEMVPVEEAAVWLRDAMRDGMAPLVHPVPVEVEVAAGPTWGG